MAERITMTIQKNLLEDLEECIKESNKSRSEIIREALIDYIKKYEWLHQIGSRAGEITLIYPLNVHKKVLDIENRYRNIILTSVSYMVNNEFLRVIVLKGPKEDIIKLTENLKSINDIKYAKLSTVGFENKK
ncbi:CopG family ribbon-helix-helix protein [Methanothermococcus okinawensis]|uniref:Transcriptional regulator NikR, CopG family n=1 Tax=Methanothermococcus okinawensis (strain DSM 14208 / JCM 11175 / IH1) TaxID=647113 RepID=F8AMZ9_METOI|nr:CopG family ribbon-helix-helix protein [Methanothermococcus okinawensis]AEH06122.1 transcriptional regulator NikR, CopG family [Methanothermococcus okinawensis IH1]